MGSLDFINALNNTMSGIYYIARGSIPTGLACTANGFIGQLSVQVYIGTEIPHLQVYLT